MSAAQSRHPTDLRHGSGSKVRVLFGSPIKHGALRSEVFMVQAYKHLVPTGRKPRALRI